jgi:O-antigen ligase
MDELGKEAMGTPLRPSKGHSADRGGPSLERPRWAARAGVLMLTLALALFLGLASAILPAWFVVSVLVLPTVMLLMLLRPEYALTAFLALTCGLFHPAIVPRLPLLGGSISAADATLLLLSAYALWLVASRKGQFVNEPVPGRRWLATSAGLFGLCLVVAIVVSLWLRQLSLTVVLGEARDLFYLLTLPTAVIILRQRERQRRFVVSLVVLGCLFAAGQILQGVFNVQVFGGSGQMVALETLGQHEYGTTRTLTRGINIIVFALMLTVGAYVLGLIRNRLFFAVAGLLFAGIFLTFGRTTYAAVAVCLVMIVVWLDVKKLPQLAGVLAIVVAVGGALGAAWKPDSMAAVVYRMTSIGTEIESGYSAKWRIWEAEAMIPHIRRHPFTGLGLGADYKGARGSSVYPDLNRYMHNAYLYMAGKMGLPALAAFLMLTAAIFAIGRRSALSDDSAWQRVVGAAGAVMMVRFGLASVTEPHFMSDYGVVTIAIAGALVYLSAERTSSHPRQRRSLPTRRWASAGLSGSHPPGAVHHGRTRTRAVSPTRGAL